MGSAYCAYARKQGGFFSTLILPAVMMAGISGATEEGNFTDKLAKGVETLGHGFSPGHMLSNAITWGAVPKATSTMFSGGNKLLGTGIELGTGMALGPKIDPVFGVNN